MRNIKQNMEPANISFDGIERLKALGILRRFHRGCRGGRRRGRRRDYKLISGFPEDSNVTKDLDVHPIPVIISNRGGRSARAKIPAGLIPNNYYELSHHGEYDIDLYSIVDDSYTKVDVKSCSHVSPVGIQIPIVKARSNYRPIHRSRPRHLTCIDVDRKCHPVDHSTVQCNVGTASFVPPRLYVFNAAALTKPHAIDQLDAELKSLKIDVAVICETHLKQKHSDDGFAIDGYRLHRRDRKRRRGGGVAVYARSGYDSTNWNQSATHSQHQVDVFELMWVQLKIQNNLIFVGAVYHPPKTSEYRTEELIDRITEDIEEIMSNNPNSLIIVAGDTNQLSDSLLVEQT